MAKKYLSGFADYVRQANGTGATWLFRSRYTPTFEFAKSLVTVDCIMDLLMRCPRLRIKVLAGDACWTEMACLFKFFNPFKWAEFPA